MPKGSTEFYVPAYEVEQSLVALGEALSRTRRARGDTQRVAAERCGLHVQTIARIERGDPGVAIGKVFALMHIYGQTARLFELSRTDESTEILLRQHLPRRGRPAIIAKQKQDAN